MGLRETVAELVERVEALESKKKLYGTQDVTRADGSNPIKIDKFSEDDGLVRLTTGVLANGGSKTVYLTWNREAGGDSIFANSPHVSVFMNATAGQALASGAGPLTETADFEVTDDGTYTKSVKWLPTNKVFAVTVTNNNGDSRDFAVLARGN